MTLLCCLSPLITFEGTHWPKCLRTWAQVAQVHTDWYRPITGPQGVPPIPGRWR